MQTNQEGSVAAAPSKLVDIGGVQAKNVRERVGELRNAVQREHAEDKMQLEC
jgi:hypothetical protein